MERNILIFQEKTIVKWSESCTLGLCKCNRRTLASVGKGRRSVQGQNSDNSRVDEFHLSHNVGDEVGCIGCLKLGTGKKVKRKQATHTYVEKETQFIFQLLTLFVDKVRHSTSM